MHRITIQYAVPADPAAFDEQYFRRHVPIVKTLPGLQTFSTSQVRPLAGEQTIYFVAQLDFDDAAALKTALTSPEMVAAGKDAATLGVPMTMFSGEVTDHALAGAHGAPVAP